jgi:cleavage and polyadenylation specificity factor subunit 4
MKGNACGFLHQFEASRMPVCRFFAKFGECKARLSLFSLLSLLAHLTRLQEPDCHFKHSDSDIKDCNMYKLGFCIHGPHCRFRHLKAPGPPPAPAAAHLTVTRPGRPGYYAEH